MKYNRSRQLLLLPVILLFSFSLQAQQVIDRIMQNPPMFPTHLIPKEEPRGKFIEQGLFAHTRPLFEIYSKASHQFAGTNEGNLYLRNPDAEDIRVIAQPKQDWYWSMDGAQWSPDGKFLAVKQVNDRAVPLIKLSHQEPNQITFRHYTRAGEALPEHQFYIVDIQSGHATAIDYGKDMPYVHLLGWNENGSSLRLLRADRLLKKLQLLTVDVVSGKTKLIFTDESDTYLVGLNLFQGYSNRLLDMNLFWFLDGTGQFIYSSEHSGFNQLYLYDKSGNLIRPLTNKAENGLVTKLIDVDTKNGWAYYTAQSDTLHTYNTQLFRSSLQEEKIEKIVDGFTFLEVRFSKGMDSLWIFQNRLPDLMQIDNYTAAGKFIASTWKADLSPLEELGFQPEYAQTMAADNKTMLEALILKPRGFTQEAKYPVVEYIYGGPHTAIVPRDFFDRSMWNMQNLANKGFIVVMMDGRGTPLRGKAFQDYTYGNFGQLEIKDHIAVLKQLGTERGYMDMDKVGVIGHSWGGYFALKALLEAPDFYKAGHVNAPNVDPLGFRVAIEPYMGCLPDDCPEKYEAAGITNNLDQLKAPLIIIHGTADDDVPIDESYKLVEALNALDYKNYEFIKYQGYDHIVMRNRIWEPAMIDFFVRHLIEK